VQRADDGAFWNGTSWQAGTTDLIASGTSAWQLPLPADAFTDGNFTIVTRAVDNAGNASAAATVTFAYDATPPETPSIHVALGSDTGSDRTDALTSDSTPTLYGRSDEGTTVTVGEGAKMFGTSSVIDIDETWEVTAPALTDGHHLVTVVSKDAAGNTASESLDVTIDTVAPHLLSASATGGTAGLMQKGDTFVIHYDEALIDGPIIGTTTVTEQKSGTTCSLTIDHVIQPVTISCSYVSGTSGAKATATADVTENSAHDTFTITLRAVTGTPATGTGSFTVVPWTSAMDNAGNVATGTAIISRLF
jgi:hypothetical protein